MKLSKLKTVLDKIETVEFALADGRLVPQHFHVTEVGQIDKRFIDCGGVLRKETVINFQLYTADDFDHRLSVQKLKSIIETNINKSRARAKRCLAFRFCLERKQN